MSKRNRCGRWRRNGLTSTTSAFRVQPARSKALRDGSYYGRQLGHGQGYIYPHNDPRGFEVDHLPDELKGKKYYRPEG